MMTRTLVLIAAFVFGLTSFGTAAAASQQLLLQFNRTDATIHQFAEVVFSYDPNGQPTQSSMLWETGLNRGFCGVDTAPTGWANSQTKEFDLEFTVAAGWIAPCPADPSVFAPHLTDTVRLLNAGGEQRMEWYRPALDRLDVWPIDFSYVNYDTLAGDANLDGQFDSSDLLQVFQLGKYEVERTSALRWMFGDFNSDWRFDSADLVAAMDTGAYEAVSVVPEPSAIMLCLLGCILGVTSSRRR